MLCYVMVRVMVFCFVGVYYDVLVIARVTKRRTMTKRMLLKAITMKRRRKLRLYVNRGPMGIWIYYLLYV